MDIDIEYDIDQVVVSVRSLLLYVCQLLTQLSVMSCCFYYLIVNHWLVPFIYTHYNTTCRHTDVLRLKTSWMQNIYMNDLKRICFFLFSFRPAKETLSSSARSLTLSWKSSFSNMEASLDMLQGHSSEIACNSAPNQLNVHQVHERQPSSSVSPALMTNGASDRLPGSCCVTLRWICVSRRLESFI